MGPADGACAAICASPVPVTGADPPKWAWAAESWGCHWHALVRSRRPPALALPVEPARRVRVPARRLMGTGARGRFGQLGCFERKAGLKFRAAGAPIHIESGHGRGLDGRRCQAPTAPTGVSIVRFIKLRSVSGVYQSKLGPLEDHCPSPDSTTSAIPKGGRSVRPYVVTVPCPAGGPSPDTPAPSSFAPTGRTWPCVAPARGAPLHDRGRPPFDHGNLRVTK